MFIKKISASVIELIENAQTHFQVILSLSSPLEMESIIQPGMLVAAENIYHSQKEERYCILQVLSSFPAKTDAKKRGNGLITLECKATPIGIELKVANAKVKKKNEEIVIVDVLPAFDAQAFVLDDEMTMRIIHHLAPESRTTENGSRVDIGTYATNPNVPVGLDAVTLIRGNIAMVSARPRARTTMTNNLVHALINKEHYPLHIVYCDVNYQGTLTLLPDIVHNENARLLSLNDKFVPPSIFSMLKTPGDRQLFKRAVYDYLDMMILPSVLESRRKDFVYPLATIFRNNKLSMYRPLEPTVDEFIHEIRMDILDGVDPDVEELLNGLMKGISENFKSERFNDTNVRDILEMIDEMSQETKIHGARRTLYDLKMEIQTVFESFAKDLPATSRITLSDVVSKLNDEAHSNLLVVQGQKPTDILRFVSTLVNKLVEERLKRLKLHVPVLFIFNNADDYFTRSAMSLREGGSERFIDVLNTLIFHGRRHGLGFCISLENCASLDKQLARKIQSYFIGPIRYSEDLALLENLLNVSGSLFQPAVSYEDGRCFFTSSDSPYQRRVPLPFAMPTNQEVTHTFLDDFKKTYEQMKLETEKIEQQKEKMKAAQAPQPEQQHQEVRGASKDKRDRFERDNRRRQKGKKQWKEETHTESSTHENMQSIDEKVDQQQVQHGSDQIEMETATPLTIETRIGNEYDDEVFSPQPESESDLVRETNEQREVTHTDSPTGQQKRPRTKWNRGGRRGQQRHAKGKRNAEGSTPIAGADQKETE